MIKGFLVFTLFSNLLISSTAGDTLAANEAIGDEDTIVSSGGVFELGFFSPGPSSSKNRYLGIWYKKKATGTVVWVANRETPLTDASGMLKLTSQGTLILVSGTNTTIWSSKSVSSLKNPVAQLLDSGNLVTKNDGDPDPGNFGWQSFDFPGNTLLAGMKIGRNSVSGLSWSPVSWKTSDDPSPGSYRVELDISGYPQLFIMNGSAIFTRLGPWNGIQFSGYPPGPNQLYKNEFVINEREISYKYELFDSSVLMRETVEPDGQVTRYTWIDQTNRWEPLINLQVDLCSNYARCGAYGSCNINKSPSCRCLDGFVPKNAEDWERASFSMGCTRKIQLTQLNCSDRDKFVKYRNIKFPDTRNSSYNLSMNLKDCKKMCLKNCSCTAYANTDITGQGSGCLLWFDELIDITDEEETGQDIYVRMAPSGSGGNNRSRAKRIVLMVFLPIISISTVLLAYYLLYLCKYRKRKKQEEMILDTNIGEDVKDNFPVFDFKTIANATNNFSISCKLGEGGFGPVYKGTLVDGQEIAVKRLSASSMQGVEEFRNEVSCIAELQHRNLVKLLGWSTEEGERLLIYEYMPNKSLDYFIFGDMKHRAFLDWPKRYNIINGIARGLLYLHQDSRLRVIHRDLKASNILLDYDMNPRISDFGMARTFGGSQTEANTARVVGTYGYMSPEYAIEGAFSVKSDVYSFGVIVIEVVTGKKSRFFSHPGHNLNLLGHAWTSYKQDKLSELIDGSFWSSVDQNEVFRVIQIGLLCAQQYPEDRPNMTTVLMMLSSKALLPHPKEPGFFTERKLDEAYTSTSSSQTVTFFAPR